MILPKHDKVQSLQHRDCSCRVTAITNTMNKSKSIDQNMYLVTGWKLYTFHKGTSDLCEIYESMQLTKIFAHFKLHNVQDNSKSVQKLWENSLFLTSMSQSRKQESTHCSQESRQPGYCSHSQSSVWRRYCCQRRAPPSHPRQHIQIKHAQSKILTLKVFSRAFLFSLKAAVISPEENTDVVTE